MKLKDCSILLIFLFTFSHSTRGQELWRGYVLDQQSNQGLPQVEIYHPTQGLLSTTNHHGYFEISNIDTTATYLFFGYDYELLEIQKKNIPVTLDTLYLKKLSNHLTQIKISARRSRLFEIKKLKDVEGTAIYAGKKSEVILLEQSLANLSTNNARQIYSQVAGLNIYENDDAGLQLNIGGRGLDPNRTSNFNTRQNGYDISADVLGYPESYYSPASEGVSEIQIIRGAASLQYGTQFGGLVNFIMKKPPKHKSIEVITRNTLGSYGLYTNFTSLGGTLDKFSYYTFYNYKTGNGFRPNSKFNSHNLYTHLAYQWSSQTQISGEITYLSYLAQQAGGLTDQMFAQDMFQSNRERNWFGVNWFLYNLKFNHTFAPQTKLSIQFFGLDAERNALGFRSNRVNQIDPDETRDLIKGDFTNWGIESRFIHEYSLKNRKSIFLIGQKLYHANNTSQQGPGSDRRDADFDFYTNDDPFYVHQSQYKYPNANLSLFGENIFYLSDLLSITPGFRFEHIDTKSEGSYKKINLDGAGNVILNETIPENRRNNRNFVLLGLGVSYKPFKNFESYFNLSQNYRSVTFTDISISNPSFAINPEITDEKGYSLDIGIRGQKQQFFSYDVNVFSLFYQQRIGFAQKLLKDGRVISERGNIGDARLVGIESLFDFSLNQFFEESSDYFASVFINTALIHSKYTASEQNGVVGNQVEFVPTVNLKSGIKFGYKRWTLATQYAYISDQFTDATNAEEANLSGIIGKVPAYGILDVNTAISFKRFKIEGTINNVLNQRYFTRRATGYPGPGIIPSPPRNFSTTLQIKF